MSRQWEPGDVALVRNVHGVWNRAICTVGPDGDTWRFGVSLTEQPVDGSEAHSLVVLDPEDWESMGVLAAAFSDYRSNIQGNASAMQAALRSLITPPKPEEPTGLGAVVEDADGESHILISLYVSNPWLRVGDWTSRHWDGIAAVEILSPGVTP